MKSKLDYIAERILVKRLIDNIELLSKANSPAQMTVINNDIVQDLYRYQIHCFLKLEEKMATISAKQINQAIKKIESELGVRPVTKYHMVQGTYSTIINDYTTGSKSGTIRTYGEAVKFRKENALKANQPYVEYTEKEYKQDLKNLYHRIEARLTVEGEEYNYRTKVQALFDGFNSYENESIDIWNMPFDQLKRIVDYMDEREMEERARKSKIDSPTKYEFIKEALENEGLRTSDD